MKAVIFWLVLICLFFIYVNSENKNWRDEMISKYGFVYVTEHGEKYHASYH